MMLPSMPSLTPYKDETKNNSLHSPDQNVILATQKNIEREELPVSPMTHKFFEKDERPNTTTTTTYEESDDDVVDWKKVNVKTPKSRFRRNQRNLKECKLTYDLLTSETELKDDINYANCYYERVTERLNPDDMKTFCDILLSINSGEDPSEVYKKLEILFLPNHSDLLDQFLCFLLPKQAAKIGKFMEHFFVTNLDKFGQMCQLYFSKQPLQMKRLYTALLELSNDSNTSIEKVKESILPLIKKNSMLTEWFLQIFPTEKPHESDLNDFERLDFDKIDPTDMYDKIIIPEENDDPYGGDNCICHCHNSENVKYKSRYLHCIPCGMKYIQGRVYVQTGKRLRPVTVTFDGSVPMTNHIKRLSAKPKPIKRRADGSPTKILLSPNKSYSSEEHRSELATDTDEESKKSPRKNTKLQTKCKNKQFKESIKNLKVVIIKENETLSKDKENKNKKLVCSNDVADLILSRNDEEIVPEPIETDDEIKPEINLDNSIQVLIPTDDLNVSLESDDKMSCVSLGSCSDASICSDSDVSVLSEKSDVINSDSEDLPIEDTEDNTNDSEVVNSLPSLTPNKVHKIDNLNDHTSNYLLTNSSDDDKKICHSKRTNEHDSETLSEELQIDSLSWSRDEDKIVLQTFQSETDFDFTLKKICEKLPHKNISDIKNRFQILLNLLEKISSQK